MINISEYSPFFIKRSFNLPKYKLIKKQKIKPKCDYLFYEIYHKINNVDITSFNQYNEIQEKTNIAETVNTFKIKNKEYILNNLLYEPIINLITLNAICKYYKINLIYLQDKIYIKMFYSESDLSPLIINNEYKFLLSIDTNNYYEITNLEKPLNSVSYYKLNELIEYAIKLDLPYTKIKKIDLYNSIYNYLVNLNIFKID